MIISLYFQFITLLNFFSNIIIFFILFFCGYLEIVSEGFVVISLVAIFTLGFSANTRNIYLGSNILNIEKVILFRILVGAIFFILVTSLTYVFVGKSNILFHSSIIFLTITNWILELSIAKYEKKNYLNIYHAVNIFLFLLISIILILLQNLFFLSLILYSSSLINFLIFRNIFKNIFNQSIIIKKLKINLAIFSTLLKTLVNFFCRYFVIIFIGKSDASILFIGFAFGSFFGTIFDVSYGALFLKKIKSKNIFINIFFIIYTTLVFLFFYFIGKFSLFEKDKFNFFLTTTIFSIFGGYFMVLALRQRQFFFEKLKLQRICYKIDIFIYLINFSIIPILYFYNKEYLITSYLLSSLFCYFIYIIYFRNVFSKKIT